MPLIEANANPAITLTIAAVTLLAVAFGRTRAARAATGTWS